MAEGYTDLQEATEDAVARALGSIEEVTRSSTARIEESFEVFMRHAEKLSTNSERTVGALESLTSRLEHIKAPDDLIVSNLMPAVQQIELLVTEARKRNEDQAVQAQDVLNTAQKSAKSANDLTASAKTILAAGQSTADAAAETSAAISDSTSKVIEKVSADMDVLSGMLSDLAGGLEKTTLQINAIGQAQERISKAEDDLISAKSRQLDAIDNQGLGKAIESAKEKISELDQQIDPLLERLRQIGVNQLMPKIAGNLEENAAGESQFTGSHPPPSNSQPNKSTHDTPKINTVISKIVRRFAPKSKQQNTSEYDKPLDPNVDK